MIIATEASERHSRKRDSDTNAKSTARIYSQKLKE